MTKVLELLKKTFPWNTTVLPFVGALLIIGIIRFICFMVGTPWPLGEEGRAATIFFAFVAAVLGLILSGVIIVSYYEDHSRNRYR